MAIINTSQGDLIVQSKNLDACQMLEYYAMCVIRFCKETQNRQERLIDIQGIAVSHMADDLKEFSKTYLGEKCNSKNFGLNVSAHLIEKTVDALEIFGGLYNSASCKKQAEKWKEAYPLLFKFRDITKQVIEKLCGSGFVLNSKTSASSSSVYIDVDYKGLSSIRISDHLSNGFDGIQILLVDGERPVLTNKLGYAYSVRMSDYEHDLEKVLEYVIGILARQRTELNRILYSKALEGKRDEYRSANPEYKSVI